MKQHIFLLLFAAGAAHAFACKNYIGNPHARPVPPKVVPTMADDLRVEPPNWWTGMLHNRVEVLVRREGLAAYEVRLGKAQGVTLEKVARGDSPNYLFLTLHIAEGAPQQKVPIVFSRPSSTESFVHEFPIWQRNYGTQSPRVGQPRRGVPHHARPLRQRRPVQRQRAGHARQPSTETRCWVATAAT
jgi:hypothetical protein